MKIIVLVSLLLVGCSSAAQPGQRNPGEMIKKEKETVLKIEGLTEDQKKGIDIIYSELSADAEKMMAEAKKNRSEMREKMGKVRAEKNEKMKKLLSDDQYVAYLEAMVEKPRGMRKK